MNRRHRIAALLAGALLSASALAAEPPPPGHHGMMGGSAPMMMHGCQRDDAPCMARMKEHRERLDQMHAVALQLKAAKNDKQRIELLQRYVELMDAQMSQMMDMMDQRMQAPAKPRLDGGQ